MKGWLSMPKVVAEESLELMQHGVAQGDLSLPQLQRVPLSHASGGVAQLFYAQAVTLVHFFWNSTAVGAFSTSAGICATVSPLTGP